MLFAVLLGWLSFTQATHFIWMQPMDCGAPCQALRPLWEHLPETFPQNTWESKLWKGSIAFGALKDLEEILYTGERSTEALLTWIEQHSQAASSQLHRNFDLIYKLGLWKGEEAVSASGHGSEQGANVAFVQFLNGLISNYSLTSVVDVGSGDWSYMKQVSIPHYTGCTAAACSSCRIRRHASTLAKTSLSTSPLQSKSTMQPTCCFARMSCSIYRTKKCTTF